MSLFRDRVDAGRRLAGRLEYLRGQDVVVLGLPRGGVPVAYEVAQHLQAPLDVVVVRKLGVPFQPELAMGAIGEGGFVIVDQSVLRRVGVDSEAWNAVEQEQRRELQRRVESIRRGRLRQDLRGRVAVIVDDGIATGSTARVACEVARHLGAARVVLAAPVAPVDTLHTLTGADEVVCVATPRHFGSVGAWYDDFAPTTDQEVVDLLDAAERRVAGGEVVDLDVEIPPGGAPLQGHLRVPAAARGVVVFAHGSGSSRHSPRNRHVAAVLEEGGFATLLMDLLHPVEELDRTAVFSIDLLAGRLLAATRWVRARENLSMLDVGYFGASTGAAAALVAAAEAGPAVRAVVSRGGRPDLAGEHLRRVTAPTLLIVGSRDPTVLALNHRAQQQLRCPSRLEVVEGATHLFEEPGTLDRAALLARDWFAEHLASTGARPKQGTSR
jgi:putative phosphoribosyl transferase